MDLPNDIIIYIFNKLDLISQIRFFQTKKFHCLEKSMSSIHHYNCLHDKVAAMNRKIIPKYTNLLSDNKFIQTNKFYTKIPIKKMHTVSTHFDIGAHFFTKIIYTLKKPLLLYKCGFTNIRCNNQNLIKSIKLTMDKNDYFSLKLINIGNYLFSFLRQNYNIEDNLIIPLITDKMIPFLEEIDFKIKIIFNCSVNIDKLADFLFEYDIVEIDKEDFFMTFQFDCEIKKIISSNSGHACTQNIITKLKYLVSGIKHMDTINISHQLMRLFIGNADHSIIEKILISTPNNTITSIHCEIILDNSETLQFPIIITKYRNDFIMINFLPADDKLILNSEINTIILNKYGINLPLYQNTQTHVCLIVEFENFGASMELDICVLDYKINKISNGTIKQTII